MSKKGNVTGQVCAIPFRRSKGKIKFCLITSLRKKRWIFPKGIIDSGETSVETALKESYEEAGLHGKILKPVLGHFNDNKWNMALRIKVVPMEVESCDERWPEAEGRERRWVSPQEALEMLERKKLRTFLSQAWEILQSENSDSATCP